MDNHSYRSRPGLNGIPFIRSPFLSRSELDWRVGPHDEARGVPTEWVPAQVPGGAQLDWAKANNWADLHYADGWRQFLGSEDRHWTYRASIRQSDFLINDGERIHFVCEGIDYACEILANGKMLHKQAGMHIPIDLDFTSLLMSSDTLVEVDVRVLPAPKSDTDNAWGEEWARNKRTQANRSTKPSVSYGDDFHPRVIPLGIWQAAYLDVRPSTFLHRAEVFTSLSDNFTKASVWVDAELNGPLIKDMQIEWIIRDAEGRAVEIVREVLKGECQRIQVFIDSPRLWWPHGHGQAHQYSSELRLRGPLGEIVDIQKSVFGIRSVRLAMHEGAWEIPHPDRWPKTRSHPPMKLEVNGRDVFARGACCVPMRIFYGTVTSQECHDLVELAIKTNFNMLRISGGCVAFKPAFYEACDRLGILVWQDFPLACNQYPDDDEYLQLLDLESRAIISRLRCRPSLAIWCGGNELFERHSGMTDQSLPVRLLNRNTLELDPDRPFIASTPLMGVAHGPYVFASDSDGGELVDATTLVQRSRSTAYPEFGCPGPASKDVLESIIPMDELFPPRRGTAWEDHNAFFPFVEREWLDLPTLQSYFGPLKSLDNLVSQGQLLQGHCLKGIFEEARRQQPMCSMAMMWSLNEPWPNAANLSLISWPQVPKAACVEVAAACRPVLASARVGKFKWCTNEKFAVELWILSDHPTSVAGGRMEVRISQAGKVVSVLGNWVFGQVEPQENVCGPTLEVDLVELEMSSGLFQLILDVDGHSEYSSTYHLYLEN